MSEFGKYLKSENEVIAQAAKLLDEATTEYNAGNLTREELTEIAEDILDIKAIDDLADQLETKIATEQAFRALSAIIMAIPV